MSSKKDNIALDELLNALSRERPRWEIQVILEQNRQKIIEENKMRDLHKVMKEYAKISQRCERLQRSLIIWQGAAITFLATILAIIVGLLAK